MSPCRLPLHIFSLVLATAPLLAATMAGNDFKLEDPTQFNDWLSSVEADLRSDGLWLVVTKGNVPAVTITNPDGSTTSTGPPLYPCGTPLRSAIAALLVSFRSA